MPAFARCIWATVFPSRDFIWRFLRRDMFLILFGGANRDRTDDLYNAIVALSQLSYGPFAKQFRICTYTSYHKDAREIPVAMTIFSPLSSDPRHPRHPHRPYPHHHRENHHLPAHLSARNRCHSHHRHHQIRK